MQQLSARPPDALAEQGTEYGPESAQSADGTWEELPPPLGRYQHAVVYDPPRDRLVVFGGASSSGYSTDVWSLTLAGTPSWSEITPAGTPPVARYGHSAIYDPVRDRIVVFGGYGSSQTDLNDVWSLDLGAPSWTLLAPSGIPPAKRSQHSAIYDPVGDRMIVHGGYVAVGGSYVADTWALTLAGGGTWSGLGGGGTPRAGHGAIYDSVRNRLIVFGGQTTSAALRNDTRALPLSGTPIWSTISASGTPPSARYGTSAIYDPVGDRMLVFAGFDGSYRADVWEMTLAGSPAWTQLAPSGPAPAGRRDHRAIYDPIRARMIAYGGYTNTGILGDVPALDLTSSPTWNAIVVPGLPPVSRLGATAVYDLVGNRILMFGGYDYNVGAVRNDVWVDAPAGSREWTLLAPSGSPPGPREWHASIWDPRRESMMVFGGYLGSNLPSDVWELSMAGSPTWSLLAVSGSPPSPRFGHTAIYDPIRDRMLVYGGRDSSLTPLAELWELSLGPTPTWTPLAPAGAPPPGRYDHSAIYDPRRDRMIVFGGAMSVVPTDILTSLQLGGGLAWTPMSPTGTPPDLRFGHSAVYDMILDRMVVFGGQGNVDHNDAWSLQLEDTPSWTHLAPSGRLPIARHYHSSVYVPGRGLMVMLGGSAYARDAWLLEFSEPTDVQSAGARLRVSPPVPNPTRSTVSFALEVPSRTLVQASVFDVAGRLVRMLPARTFDPGRHPIVWDGRSASGREAPSGVYFCKIVAGGVTLARRVVVLQ